VCHEEIAPSIVLVVLPAALPGQARPLDPEATVQQALEDTVEGGYSSMDVKGLGWLGDASAVALTKGIGGKTPYDRETGDMLLVIFLSYSDPRVVTNDSDRQLRTTLFLLRYLDLATKDAKGRPRPAATGRVWIHSTRSPTCQS
jgi:hypothetical protein